MKLILKALKYFGILILIVASIAGTFFYCFLTINDSIYLETTQELIAEFGEFEEGEILKKERIAPLKVWVISWMGVIKPELKRLNRTNLYRIAYKSDGLIVHGLMAEPKAEGSYPCLIYNRGGNRNAGRLSFRQATEFMIPYADNGYVVIASNYRGNNGGEGADEFGGSDVNDIMNLIPVLAELKNADTSRIGLLGHSRGGMMTYLALKNHGVFKTGVVIAGSADKFKAIEHRPEMGQYVYAEMMPNYDTNRDEVLASRSVVRWPEKLDNVPLLLLHGTADDRVLYEEAESVAFKLDSLNRNYQFVSFEGDDHSLRNNSEKSKALINDWLDKYLRDARPFDESEHRITIPTK